MTTKAPWETTAFFVVNPSPISARTIVSVTNCSIKDMNIFNATTFVSVGGIDLVSMQNVKFENVSFRYGFFYFQPGIISSKTMEVTLD